MHTFVEIIEERICNKIFKNANDPNNLDDLIDNEEIGVIINPKKRHIRKIKKSKYDVFIKFIRRAPKKKKSTKAKKSLNEEYRPNESTLAEHIDDSIEDMLGNTKVHIFEHETLNDSTNRDKKKSSNRVNELLDEIMSD